MTRWHGVRTSRQTAAAVVSAACALAACSSPPVESEAPWTSSTHGSLDGELAPSVDATLVDLATDDPLPFPGYEVDRVTIAPLPGSADSNDTDQADQQPALTGWAAFDEEIRRSVLDGGSDAVSVAIAVDGEVVHEAALGVARPATGEPVEIGDRFRIASISKVITAITVLQLVEEGLVGLDEPVGERIAAAAGSTASASAAGITVRQLLSHTSGLPQDESLFFRKQVGSCTEAAARVLNRSVSSGGFRYSNSNFCALGLLIESLTGDTYERAVYEYLLTPLGISGMRLAPTYDPGPGEVEHRSVPDRNYMEVLAGAGAWVATPSELVTILDSLDHGTPGWKPLEPVTVALMKTAVNDPNVPDRGYGLGLILYGAGAAGHTGTVESTHAMALDRADNVTWAITVSGENPSESSHLARIIDRALVAGGFVAG